MNAQRAKGVEYGVLDTMQDIVANTVGSLIGCIALFAILTKKSPEEIHAFLEEWFIVPEEKEERGKKILNKHRKQIVKNRKQKKYRVN